VVQGEKNGFLSEKGGALSQEGGFLSEKGGALSQEGGFLGEKSGFRRLEGGFLSETGGFLGEKGGFVRVDPGIVAVAVNDYVEDYGGERHSPSLLTSGTMPRVMEREERQYKPGERVPGTEYVVVRLEAEGGHGALYLVRHHFLEKKIQMLKTLRGFEPSADLIERLKREAQMLAAMDHPHIVSVTSGGLTDEKHPRPYFVMERLKGRSLAQILPEAPQGVGVDAALKVTIEVCDALEYVHTRHGVVHRDIKPDNVFLQVTPRNGSVTKLLDFGVAHIMDLEKRYTKNNLFLGTPRYASPEQIMGDKPSPQTDLYAVGLLLYELLLGHGPFDDATNFAAVATAHVQLPPPGFPKTRRFPDGLEALVMSLLRKKDVERPKSAEWLATQLRQIKRIAEMAEHVDTEDLNRTDASPMQNVLTGHRAHLTEAGSPPDLPSEPALSDPASQTASQTAPESPLGYRSTMRMSPLAAGEPALDRAAATRSLHVEAPTPKRSDTEEIQGARGWLPAQPEPDTAPSSRRRESGAQAGMSTSAAIELTPIPPRAGHRRPVMVMGGVIAVGLLVLVGVLTRSSAGPTTAGGAAATTTSSTTSTPSSTPSATPTATPTPVDSTPPLPTAPRARTPSAPRKPASAPAPLRVPGSGLD
jgi:serine/threonine protein kinase